MPHAYTQELKDLTNFLNLRLTKKFDVESGPTAQGVKFIDSLGIVNPMFNAVKVQLPELLKAQQDIKFFLQCLQPEVFEKDYPRRLRLKPRDVPVDEFSEKFNAQNRTMIADFEANPGHFFYALVDQINDAERRAEWILQEAPPAKTANFTFHGSRWLLKKYPYGGRGTVFHWVAGILERDELSKLGCCHVCKRFFLRARDWQVYCGDKCRIKNDNWESAHRKADRKAAKKRVQTAKQKTKGLPRFKELAAGSLEHIRQIFGEKLDDFLPFASRVRENGEPAEKVWRKLPPWMKKILAAV